MKIVKESLATRCEICHQADSFIGSVHECVGGSNRSDGVKRMDKEDHKS